jgi:chemotaxis protein MotB
MASQQQAPEQIPFPVAQTVRPARGSAGWLFAALLLLIASGLGYYAFALHAERDGIRRVLDSNKGELTRQRTYGKDLLAQLRTLERESAEQTALSAQTSEKLQSASAELAAAHTRLDELDAERGQIKEQLADFKQMTQELSRMIDSGRLKVSFRRGRMIVELPAQVLFASGSSDLTNEGMDALAQVAKSLRGFKSRNFIVAGHTDTVPVVGKYASNWELSSARAVTVTGALIRGGLRPEQLVAAGYSEFDPVARNTTEAGKQQNRRIEIILEPRLREFKAAGAESGKTAASKQVASSKPVAGSKLAAGSKAASSKAVASSSKAVASSK